MSQKLLNDEVFKYTQTQVYVSAQILWILIYIGIFIAILFKMDISGKSAALKILLIFILIVCTVIGYYVINRACEKGYPRVAWVLAFLPYVGAPSWGYDIVSKLIKINNNRD